MGKYLDSLKTFQKPLGGEPNKPNKPPTDHLGDSSLGLLGSPPSTFRKIHSPDAMGLSAADETAIRGWLSSIGEDDPSIIGEVLNRCSQHTEARQYFLMRAGEP